MEEEMDLALPKRRLASSSSAGAAWLAALLASLPEAPDLQQPSGGGSALHEDWDTMGWRQLL